MGSSKKQASDRAYYWANRDAQLARNRSYRQRNPIRERDRYRLRRVRKYGITLQDVETMLAQQGGGCAICGGADGRWCVDHCHKTNRVRGVLCHHCNIVLGMAQDNPRILMEAASYLIEATK